MIITELRNKTASCHKKMEESLDLFHRIITVSDYKELLSKWLGYLEPLELSLGLWMRNSHLDFETDFTNRKKVAKILADLRALGMSVENISLIPRCNPEDLPLIDSISAAVGVAYVLEGSTLGGQFICREFTKKLDLSPERGLSFFHGYGLANASMWKDFMSGLEKWETIQPRDCEISTNAAINTFTTLEKWLCHES